MVNSKQFLANLYGFLFRHLRHTKNSRLATYGAPRQLLSSVLEISRRLLIAGGFPVMAPVATSVARARIFLDARE
jgi:hypothetical protein